MASADDLEARVVTLWARYGSPESMNFLDLAARMGLDIEEMERARRLCEIWSPAGVSGAWVILQHARNAALFSGRAEDYVAQHFSRGDEWAPMRVYYDRDLSAAVSSGCENELARAESDALAAGVIGGASGVEPSIHAYVNAQVSEREWTRDNEIVRAVAADQAFGVVLLSPGCAIALAARCCASEYSLLDRSVFSVARDMCAIMLAFCAASGRIDAELMRGAIMAHDFAEAWDRARGK